MTRGDFWRCGLLVAGSLAACSTNHSALEKKPNTGNGGGGAGGTVSGGSGFHSQLGGTGGALVSNGGHADDEPPGRSVLTIVNGVVDAPRVAWCFAQVGVGASVVPLGAASAALDYGHSMVLREVPFANLADDTLQAYVIAGDLELISGLDCRASIARARLEETTTLVPSGDLAEGGAGGQDATFASLGGSAEGGVTGERGGSAGAGEPASAARPRLRVRGLPAIPAGALSSGRSLVLIANGCLGGRGFSGLKAEQYCGAGYTETEPTVSANLVALSRALRFDRVGLQVVHGSLANLAVDFRSGPTLLSEGGWVSIASRVVQGQVAPRPALLNYTASDYGATRLYRVEVSATSGVLFSEGWATVLARGGLTELSSERTYALVLSGPQGDLPAVPGLWNLPALTAIDADPE